MPSRKKSTIGIKPKSPKTVASSPYWTLKSGVSYSLLSRFINCRERFRLYAVEGLREVRNKEAMTFGKYFHKFIELHSLNPNSSVHRLISLNCEALDASLKPVANTIFEEYLHHFHTEKHTYLPPEAIFDIKYRYLHNRTMRLRGRFDGIIKKADGTLWIMENKTKGRINPYQLESSIPFNLQTMFYATAAQLHYNRPVTGILYNVIRKPGHKQKKSETEAEFISRIRELVQADPSYFFYRWEFELPEGHLRRWQERTLNPLLRAVELWWNSVKHDPFSPWLTRNGQPNPHHTERPFGLYEPMTLGNGDYFDLITRNKRIDLTTGNDPFIELTDNPDDE